MLIDTQHAKMYRKEKRKQHEKSKFTPVLGADRDAVYILLRWICIYATANAFQSIFY